MAAAAAKAAAAGGAGDDKKGGAAPALIVPPNPNASVVSREEYDAARRDVIERERVLNGSKTKLLDLQMHMNVRRSPLQCARLSF